MKIFMFFMLTFVLLTTVSASNVSWCDDFDYCSRDYQCRTVLDVKSYGMMKLVPDFSTLIEQCGMTGEANLNSIRIVSHGNTSTYAPYYHNNVLLFSAEKGPGLYYLYFSNITGKPKSAHPLEYEWEEVQDCSLSAWTQQVTGNYLIFSTSGNDGYCDLNFNGWYSAFISQAYYPDFMPMRFSYDVPSYGTADGGCSVYGGGGVSLSDIVSASPGGIVRSYTSSAKRCSGISSYQVDDIVETTNATYVKAWGVGGAGNGQFNIKNYKAYIAKYDAEAGIVGTETPTYFGESETKAAVSSLKMLTVELKNTGDEDAKNISLEVNIGALNETEIAVIRGNSIKTLSLNLGSLKPGVYDVELLVRFDANGFEKIKRRILVYNETVHQSEAWLSLTDFGEYSSFILNRTLHFINNGTEQFDLSDYAEDFCFDENESKLLGAGENKTLDCYFEFSDNFFVSENISNESIALNLKNPYPYAIEEFHWEYLKSLPGPLEGKELQNTTGTLHGINFTSAFLARMLFTQPVIQSQPQQDNGAQQTQQTSLSQNPQYQGSNEPALSYVVDAVPPVIEIVTPKNNESVTDARVTVTAKVTDISDVTCFVILDDEQQSMYVSGNRAEHTFLYVPDGNHNVAVKCTDSYGNSRKSTLSFTVSTEAELMTQKTGEIPDRSALDSQESTQFPTAQTKNTTSGGTAAAAAAAGFPTSLLLSLIGAAVAVMCITAFLLYRYRDKPFIKHLRKVHLAKEQKRMP